MTVIPFSINSLPGPEDILRNRLANGATVLCRANFFSPAVAFRGYLPAGTIAEPAGKNGLANVTSSTLMAGTRRHAFQALHDAIESMGALLSISSGKLATTIGGNCLQEDLGTLLKLLREVLGEPAFPEDHLQRVKTQTLTAIAIMQQDTAEMADEAYDRLFYGSHPYAIPDIGYTQDVAGIQREDVVEFHHRHYGPKGMVMAFSGGVEPEKALESFADIFGNWDNPAQQARPELPPYVGVSQTRREHVPLEEKSQTDLVIGTLAPKTHGPDYQACTLGDSILGQFGMMGRIGESVREKAGLAYYAHSNLEGGLGPVSWRVEAGVNPDNLDKAIGLILEEIKRFINEPVSDEELDDVRSQALGRLPLALESNAGIAGTLVSMERYQLELDYLRKLPERLAAVNAQQILEAARRYWDPEKLVITSAGRALA